MTFLHQSRAITLLFINEFSLFAIPNHSSPISMSMQSLKKIGQKLLRLESGNEALTDGRTDVLMRVQLRIAPHKSAPQNVVRYGHTRTNSICEMFSPNKCSRYTWTHMLRPTMDTLSKLVQTNTFQTPPTPLPPPAPRPV